MAKKTGSSILLLLMLFVLIAGTLSKAACAQEKTAADDNDEAAIMIDSTGNYRYTVNKDGTAEILDYMQEEKEIVIPSQLDGHCVTTIGRNAFWSKSPIYIQLPDTVTDISAWAFACSNISSITMPESVIRIGEYAFCDCKNLKEVFISKNVKEIGGNIFQGSSNLTNIEVDPHNGVYSSMDGILYSKDMTELLTVPGGKDLAGFQIPDSVVCIGTTAFQGCVNEFFTEITIPDQVKTIKNKAFANSNLTAITIGKGVTEIEDDTFMECNKLSDIVVTGSLKKISDRAFYSCSHLSEITIPDSVKEIGDQAFYDCTSLKNIAIPKSVQKIGRYAIGFEGEYYNHIRGVSITGCRDTEAYYYAKRRLIAFHEAETGEVLRFDLVPVPIPKEKITVLKGRKKKIELKYYREEDVSYQIAIKKAGTSSWKNYYKTKTWTVIKGLKPGKQYKVKVRAWREIDGNYYYGKWSNIKKVAVR